MVSGINFCAESGDEELMLKIRKTFIVNTDTFKLGITRISAGDYKIHISKKLNGEWRLQNRYVEGSDDYVGYQLVDWNLDGYTDVELSFTCNNGPELANYLLLFDPSEKCFRKIENFWHYCDGYEHDKMIDPKKPYYYSFIERGCSGDYYESYFFTVQEFRMKILGFMEIDYCQLPWQILIYTYDTNNKPVKKATIPRAYIERNYSGEGVVWKNCVSNYWKKHGCEFI